MKERLTEPIYWENGYYRRRRERPKYLPNPRKYRGHYELDCIFKSLFKLDKSKKFLELGAGGSIWLPYFAKEFEFEVYGIDYSKTGCELAKRNLNLAGVKGHIFCEDFFQSANRWKGFFDVILSFGVVEHFDKPVEIIKIMKNLLKTDGLGLVITVVPNADGLPFQLQKIIDRDVYNVHKIFSLVDLSSYHNEAGMHVILSRYLQFMDLGIINYQRIVKGKLNKWGARAITGINLPILYLQKALCLFPQSKRLCSFMIVVAKNTGL